jgi:hypothetical protein
MIKHYKTTRNQLLLTIEIVNKNQISGANNKQNERYIYIFAL